MTLFINEVEYHTIYTVKMKMNFKLFLKDHFKRKDVFFILKIREKKMYKNCVHSCNNCDKGGIMKESDT